MIDTLDDITAALRRAEAAEKTALRWERLLRRLWFFMASVIPHEWRDETMQRWIKDDCK